MTVGAMARTKGAAGERELARLLTEVTGHDITRRVRNLKGEDDLQGLPGWSIECKRNKTGTPAQVSAWWRQAKRQAAAIGCEPVLFYRADFGQWRAVWNAELLLTDSRPCALPENATVEGNPQTWWAVCGM